MGLCRDRVFSVATKFGLRPKGLLSRHNIFVLRRSWPSQEFSVTTEYFYAATELSMVERLYLTIEYFMLR